MLSRRAQKGLKYAWVVNFPRSYSGKAQRYLSCIAAREPNANFWLTLYSLALHLCRAIKLMYVNEQPATRPPAWGRGLHDRLGEILPCPNWLSGDRPIRPGVHSFKSPEGEVKNHGSGWSWVRSRCTPPAGHVALLSVPQFPHESTGGVIVDWAAFKDRMG